MDSQVAYPPAGTVYENAPPNVGLQQVMEGQEGEQQQQRKKSVLKKVKAKAKKMKDTIAKRTTGQSNGAGDQVPDDHDLEQEDDEDEYEEMAEDNQQPELHGAPIYESTEARNPAVGKTWSENRNGDGKGENSTQPLTPEILSDWTKSTVSSKKDGPEEEELSKLNLSEPIDLEEDTQARTDPDHKPSHQFKVIDPSGEGSTEETGVTNLIRSFEKMNSESNPEPELQKSHSPQELTDFQSRIEDQFSPEPDVPTPVGDSSMSPEKMETDDYPPNQSGYTQKVSAATSAFTDRAISAKNMVASKLGYGEKGNETETPEEYSASRGEDSSKFTAATTAIADGAISAKDAVTSKLGYGQKDNESETIEENSSPPGDDGSKLSAAPAAIADKAIYTKNAVVSKLGYGQKDNEEEIPEANSAAPGGEGNTFSAATSAIADRAISAKNMVVSKLGYGEKDSESVTHENDRVKESSASPVEYGKKVAGNVYEKVAGAGSTLASKVWGTPAGAEKEEEAAGGEKKGVSVKDYLSEKLKPGEEDKALSEVVSGTLYKNKDEPSETDQQAATVTESEEENRDKQNVTGEGMVGKIKDTVGSWIGKGGGELQASPQAFGTSQGVEGFVDSGRNEGEERRLLKESTN